MDYINEKTWKFVRNNKEQYNRLQKIILNNDEAKEAVNIVAEMIEQMPKTIVTDIIKTINRHAEIYAITKNIPEEQKRMALEAVIAYGMADLGMHHISRYRKKEKKNMAKPNDCFDDITMMLIKGDKNEEKR